MNNSFADIIKENTDFLKKTWIFFLIAGFVTIIIFSFYHYNLLKNNADILKSDFIRNLHHIEEEIDYKENSLLPLKNVIYINLEGVITRASSEKIINTNISKSSFFKNIIPLKIDEFSIIYYPDFIETIPRLYYIKRYYDHYRAVPVKPELVFGSRIKFGEYLITDQNNICIYSPDIEIIGDPVKTAPLSLSNGAVRFTITGPLGKIWNMNYFIFLDITPEFLLLFLFITSFAFIFIFLRRKSAIIKNDLSILDNEYDSISMMMGDYLQTSNQAEKNIAKRLDSTIISINKFLTKSGARKLYFKENMQFMNLTRSLMNHILELTRQSINDTDALKKSEERYRLLFDNANDAIIIHDYKGHIIEANRAACERLGYSCSELKELSLNDIIHQDYNKFIQERIDEIIRNQNKIFESIHITSENTSIPVEVNSRILDYDGKPAILSISRDITERKKAYELIIQTEKMTTVGGLAAGMAHEINNPLGIILQGVQVALNRLSCGNIKNIETAEKLGTDIEKINAYLTDRKIFEYMDGIREAGKRAANIVNNMLLFSRRSTYKYTTGDINKIIDDTIEIASQDFNLRKKYDFKNIAINRIFDADLPHVSCVANEIEQVILNILRNSSQAMASLKDNNHKPEITIKTSTINFSAQIEITDNGPGMSMNAIRHLFEPFYTTKEAGEGTGLGLSVSYFIITNNHHGTISAESEAGKYTKIIITLPFKKE